MLVYLGWRSVSVLSFIYIFLNLFKKTCFSRPAIKTKYVWWQHIIPEFRNIQITSGNHQCPLLSSYHISVVPVVEVKSWQDGFELVENLIVPCHVSGQNASAITTEYKPYTVVLSFPNNLRKMCMKKLRESERWSHLMIPSLIRLYWSVDIFLKMLLSVYKTENPLFIVTDWIDDRLHLMTIVPVL